MTAGESAALDAMLRAIGVEIESLDTNSLTVRAPARGIFFATVKPDDKPADVLARVREWLSRPSV